MKPLLTSGRFDKLIDTQQNSPGNSSKIIWTLPAIGRRIGVGPDFVRDTLAKQVGSPIKEIGGRYYVFEDALIEYMRNGGPATP